jgi:hypothetical protein
LDDDSDELSSDSEWNKHGRRRGSKDKGEAQPLVAGGAMGPSGSKSAGTQQVAGLGFPLDQYGSNLNAAAEVLPSLRLLEAAKSKTVVPPGEAGGSLGSLEESLESGELDSHITDPLPSWVDDSQQVEGPSAKVARLAQASPPRSSCTEEVEAVDASDEEELEVQERAAGDLMKEVAVATPLAQGLRSKAIYFKRAPATLASAVRKSARTSTVALGTSALARAQQLTAEKNLEGKTTLIGKEKGNDFAVLDLFPDSHLSAVVLDSCLVFNPSAGEPEEALSIIRAKEKVQAAIAETACRLAREAEAAAAAEVAANQSVAQGEATADQVLAEAGASTSAARRGGSGASRSRPIRSCVKATVRPASTRQYKRRAKK